MKFKVLYAEDGPTLAEIIGDGLKSSGYDVKEALDGQTALQLFEFGTPDICVLDIMLPVKDGYTLA